MFTIDNIITTLNRIEVKGKNNMDMLLGAILALEAMREADKKTVVPKEAEEPTEDEG